MYLLVTAQAGLHGRRLLLVPEGWRVGQRGDTPVGTELRLGEAELTEYRGVLTGHGEEGVLLGPGPGLGEAASASRTGRARNEASTFL